MTRFSDAAGRKIVSTSTAETVGKVGQFLVDPRRRTVLAVGAAKNSVLRWADIHAFGQDAVTVSGGERLSVPDENLAALSGKDHEILGKRVLNTAGDEIGRTVDVEFDPESAEIVELVLDRGPIDGRRLVGVGSYAVIVQADGDDVRQPAPPPVTTGT